MSGGLKHKLADSFERLESRWPVEDLRTLRNVLATFCWHGFKGVKIGMLERVKPGGDGYLGQ